jgi:hypothetical protein
MSPRIKDIVFLRECRADLARLDSAIRDCPECPDREAAIRLRRFIVKMIEVAEALCWAKGEWVRKEAGKKFEELMREMIDTSDPK